ncbi:hypothetical protein CRYUN_Cryun26dG0031100 [Craigia yunnanensis]
MNVGVAMEEIEKLCAKNGSFQNKELKGESVIEVSGITASQSKTATYRGSAGPFGILVLASKDLTEQSAIFFRIFRSNDKYVVLMCSDQSRSSLREGPNKATYGVFIDRPSYDKISLRSLIDHSIVESFGGEGRACITARVYPKQAIRNQAYQYAFNNGTFDVTISTLNVWSMKKAQIISATKRRKPHLH